MFELRIKHLEEQYCVLTEHIHKLESTVGVNNAELASLKKQRLRLKAEIVTIKQDHLQPPYRIEYND